MFIIGRNISATFSELFRAATCLQQGNLNVFLEVRSSDRFGALANALNVMSHKMRRFLIEISQHSALVDSASGYLLSCSNEMSQAADQLSQKAGSIAAAAEEVSTNIAAISMNIHSVSGKGEAIAASTKSMSDSINAVSASIEEMSRSIEDVARHCAEAQEASATTMQISDVARQKAIELQRAVENIDEVTKLINEITDQTKLLALNATIEAARAGDAGRGFSVVAKEVKELASEASGATESIQASVRTIKGQTDELVRLIKEISSQNQELNAINTSIASATEQQSSVATEIARNVSGTATTAEEMSGNVHNLTTIIQEEIVVSIEEASKGVVDLSSGMQHMNDKIKEAASASAGNFVFARDVSGVASELKKNLGKFDIGTENFDIGRVKAAHLAWKTKLEGMLHKGMALSRHKIPDHTQCDFGKWIVSPEGQALKNEASFAEMMDLHEQVHALAYQITDLYYEGRQRQAKEMMNRFEETRKSLFATLDTMYRVS